MMGAYEGGIRIPGIIRWPRRVKAGIKVSTPTSTMDFLPTLGQLLDADIPTTNGQSYLQLLTKDGDTGPAQRGGRVLRHYCGTELHALRTTHDFDGKVYKAWFKQSRLAEGVGHCGPYVVCDCFEDVHDFTQNPKIIDIEQDPQETSPISADHPA